ncbi:MAG TPA: AAA family ATPase [Anaeromyxobacteraceae bacterium]|nr:AAA family ATPase [Anaeromyxobacteraceae bacterium]
MPGVTLEALQRFFESSPAARRAVRPLARGARVDLALPGGPAHFTMSSGEPRVVDGPATDPDFALMLPAGAVERITSLESDDVGEFGVAFFQLVLERDPALKVRVHIQAGTPQLLSHGYIGVLALGGLKVTWWLIRNGIRNPRAAIDRLRGTRRTGSPAGDP